MMDRKAPTGGNPGVNTKDMDKCNLIDSIISNQVKQKDITQVPSIFQELHVME